ncbi:acetyl-CoA carboxylase biotin carboxyl carrier protein [Pseudomonas sp. LJDD11]|uniref:acetyl-CoA carboxylase biotin carboxyl carrier protein n=1 Tax=Pseudomonas sp. LJDD11 TaxID=2931984 RepID=UPI00211C965B|nr:acetyl-CoA carboxylase biotin carboxyl carrier protein [Pseudomonas sp. LJDD11]MCQ9427248.1 acetyl-CoA carboxylase biotin carboxyl carrier protein [Pseudomonas sp. LJDD11]
MDQHRIKDLIDLIGASDLTELSLSEGGSHLHLARHGRRAETRSAPLHSSTAAPQPTQAPSACSGTEATPQPSIAATHEEVPSPLYGVLHLTPSPDEPAFVQPGDTVSAGQTLCIVEAMKMFHQVSAPAAGTVKTVLGQSGTEVERGQPLFHIVTAG